MKTPETTASQTVPATRRAPRVKESVRAAVAAARAEAEAAQAQLQAMQALTDTALSYLTLDDLLRELLGRVTAVMGVDHVAILLLDEDRRTLTARAARGLLEETVGSPRFPLGQGFAGRVAATREPLIVDDVLASDVEGVHPLVREHLRSGVAVPLLAQDVVEDPLAGHRVSRLLGVLEVGSATPRRFTAADVQLLQRAADRIALAIDRVGLFAAEQDARRRAEVALARALVSEAQIGERAERLHTILETMADGVAVCDAEGRPLQLVNRAYRELYALDQAPAGFETLNTFERARLMQMRDAATGMPLSPEKTPVGRALRGEIVAGPGADIRLRAFDGRELEINFSAAPLREPSGRIVGAVCVLRDMTERKQLEREREEAHARAELARTDELAAREASRRMEEFLATAAHDLRSPLASTAGYIDLAERQTERLAAMARQKCPDLAPRLEAVRSRMSDAGESAEQLTQLLTMLFDTAAIHAARLELHRAPCDLVVLMRQQVEALRMAAPGRTIRLHAPPGGEPLVVEADADRIRQVVANYVTNALKYSATDQPVDIFVETRRSQARVAVRDAGQGIPKAERACVWELFHRAPGAAAQGRTYGGSLGLGLHISKAIIEAHGGQVGLKSAVGHGSTFWFTLPLAGPTPGPSDPVGTVR